MLKRQLPILRSELDSTMIVAHDNIVERVRDYRSLEFFCGLRAVKMREKENHDVFSTRKKSGNFDGSSMIRSMLSSTDAKGTRTSLSKGSF